MLPLGVLPTFLSFLDVAAELLRGILGFLGGVVSCIVGRFARFTCGFVGLFLGVPFALPAGLFVVRMLAGNQRERT